MKNKQNWVLIILAGLILLGFFLRFYHIDLAPSGIYPDEAVNAQDALVALQNNDFKWFYPDNDGREALFINLVAASIAIFGVSAFSLKLPAILLGTLTILGTYLLTKELFKDERISLAAAFFTTVSFWAINFSRISFRANMLPWVLVWSFYFLFRGLSSKKIIHFIAAGAIFGLGLHSYIAFRIAPFVLVGWLPFLILSRSNFLRDFWRQGLAFIGAFIIVASPMLFTFYQEPQYFWSRTNEVSVFSAEVNHGHPWVTLGESIKLSLLKYNFIGDMNWRNSFPPFPILNPALGMLFLWGALISIGLLLRAIYLRIFSGRRLEDLSIHAFLWLWFALLLVPEFMTNEGNPHALRAIGTAPVVYIWAAFFVGWLLTVVDKYIGRGKYLIYTFFLLVFIFIGVFDGLKYFYFWAPRIETARAFEKNITEAAHFIENSPKELEIYAVLDNMQRVVVRAFNWERNNFRDIHPRELDKLEIKNPNNVMFVFSDYQKTEIIENLTRRFPKLVLSTVTDEHGLTYYILK